MAATSRFESTKMSKPILIDYWRSGSMVVNMGDYVNEVLVGLLGYETDCYPAAKAGGRLAGYETCLLGAGSVLDHYWFDRIGMRKRIWGSGYWGDERFGRSYLAQCTIHAVRGPITRHLLGLDDGTPLGDPALLLPQFRPLERTGDTGIVYVPHFHSRTNLPRSTLGRLGADTCLDAGCLRSEFWDRIQAIVNAEFILTSSLHGAIFAQAYGRPWALCCPEGSRHDKPLKWADWFAYLGLRTVFCSDLEEGRAWWSRIGCRAVVGDLRPLLQSFPHPC